MRWKRVDSWGEREEWKKVNDGNMIKIVRTKEDFKDLKETDFFEKSFEANLRDNPYRGENEELGSFYYIVVDYRIEGLPDVKFVCLNPELLDLWNSTYPHLGV